MPFELPDGLVFLERGWLSSNAVLLNDGVSSTLIDSGYFTHSPLLHHFIDSHLGDRSLDMLVNTHLHSDHVGANASLQAKYPFVQTLIPAGLFSQVQAWNESALSFHMTGQFCPKFIANKPIFPGDRLDFSGFQWEVHASPGHDNDALLLFNPHHRILISADALWANGFGVVFPEICGGEGFEEVADTLNLIEALDPLIVLPGHGPVITDVAKSLHIARSKLSRFIRDPELHAMHAAKVLLKFKLLEWQRCQLDDFQKWALVTPLIKSIHQHFFHQSLLSLWLEGLIQDLIAKNVARIDGQFIHNC